MQKRECGFGFIVALQGLGLRLRPHAIVYYWHISLAEIIFSGTDVTISKEFCSWLATLEIELIVEKWLDIPAKTQETFEMNIDSNILAWQQWSIPIWAKSELTCNLHKITISNE